MSKDHRTDRKRCLRCTNWAEYQSELCADCEQDVLDELEPNKVGAVVGAGDFDGPHGGISPDALRVTHFSGFPDGTDEWKGTFTVKKGFEGYTDSLDQARASSMDGGE